MARGIVHHAAHLAALQLWGQPGLRVIGGILPSDVRVTTIDQPIEPLSWLPERHMVAWYEAVLRGPCGGNDPAYCAWVDRLMDLSFGRVRKLMLSLITPQGMIERGAELWRHDHTHGTLRVTTAPRGAVAVLRDHPFVHSEPSRRALAEVYRYAISLSRAKDVRETHTLDGQALVVRMTWG